MNHPPLPVVPTLQLLLKENVEALEGPVFSDTHIDFLFKTFMHLLQLQLMLAAQLGLVPMFFLLEQPKLSEFLAPERLKNVDISFRKWPQRAHNSQPGTMKAGAWSGITPVWGRGTIRAQASFDIYGQENINNLNI